MKPIPPCRALPASPPFWPSLAALALLTAILPASARADHPSLSLEDGGPGPVTALTAVPLPAGATSTSVQSQFLFCDEIPPAELIRQSLLDEHVHSVASLASLSLHAAHGFTEDITAGFSLPYLWRADFRSVAFAAPGTLPTFPVGTGTAVRPRPRHAGHGHPGGGGVTPRIPYVETVDFEGPGDATFYGHYRFWKDPGHEYHAALILGLKAPTGRTDLRTPRGPLIESDHQPGSGSWDPLLGFVFTRRSGPWSLDLGALHSFVQKGDQDTDRGDILNCHAALSYRLAGPDPDSGGAHPHSGDPGNPHPGPCHGPAWDLILEANGDWREPVRIADREQDHTGGHQIFLAPGARVSFPNGWAASVSLGFPVLSDLRGLQAEPNSRLLFGISRGF